MRRLFIVLTIVLISATLSFAQGTTVQDDPNTAPIQAGYAVVTPVVVTTTACSSGTTTTTTTGLVAFETFGLREFLGGALQAGVLPPDLTTSALLFVDHDDRLGKNIGVAIVNPNSADAHVTLTLRKKDGTIIATATPATTPALDIASDTQIAKLVTELFPAATAVPGELTGTLTITSDVPVSVIGLRFRGINFSTIPATNLAASSSPLPMIGAGGGPGAILLPQFVAGAGWATELVLANTNNTTPMSVRVDLFKPNGMPLTAALNGQTLSSFTNISVCPGGVVVLAPRDSDGDDDF